MLPERFVIIDNDPVSNLICRQAILSAHRTMQVLEFTSPHEGLEFITTFSPPQPAIILLDINMPMLDGWEFLDKLESADKRITELLHIFIISSSVDNLDRERALAHPLVKGYIIKPFRWEIILETLNKKETR